MRFGASLFFERTYIAPASYWNSAPTGSRPIPLAFASSSEALREQAEDQRRSSAISKRVAKNKCASAHHSFSNVRISRLLRIGTALPQAQSDSFSVRAEL